MPTYQLRIGELGEMFQPPPTASLEEIRTWDRALLLIYPDAELELTSRSAGKDEVTVRKLDPAPTWTRK